MNDINLNKELNVVYIGNLAFPRGNASTKRRRYMVDYMNAKNIQSHVLITGFHSVGMDNRDDGMYGLCDYHDISSAFSVFNIKKYYGIGKKWLKKWFDRNKLNILIFHTILDISELPFFLYAQKLGYKIVFDQVETSYIAPGTSISLKAKVHVYLNELVGKYAYKKCNGCFVISRALVEQNQKDFPDMPLCLLPNSTPILLSQEKTEFNKTPIILYAGTYAPKDGVEYLLKAFLKVLDHGYNCQLILTGKGIDKDMQVLDLVKNNPHVNYLGRVSDEKLNEVLLTSDVLTMTRVNSKFANCGFPFKVSEYLSTGNPVLASKVSDIEDYLIHKKNAYLVEPNNVDDIANGIEYLLDNPAKALNIGKEGLHVAETTFSIDAIGGKFVDFLYSLDDL